MNPFVFVLRRPIMTLTLAVALAGGAVLGLSTLQIVKLPPLSSSTAYGGLEYIGEKAGQAKTFLVAQYQSYFHKQEEEHHEENRKIVLTSPKVMDVTVTLERVCQIRSQRHIEVCALDNGYLEEISVREGQGVKRGEVMFRLLPILYKARLDAEIAEARLAELEYKNTESLFKGQAVVSQNEVLLFKAKFDKAKAKIPADKIVNTGVEVIEKANVADFEKRLAEWKK